MPKISVIVPIYNVERYLSECINSILRQTFSDFECILINDGSTDTCGEICNNYQKIDNRIKIIHQSNKGVSAARNMGLNIAKGEYITFIDSDDIIHHSYLYYLYNTAKKYNTDLVQCFYTQFTKNKPTDQDIDIRDKIYTLSGYEAILKHYRNADFSFMVWDKLYSRRLVGKLRFPEQLRNEDEFFNNHILLECEKIIQIPQSLYYYRVHQISFSKKIFSEQNLDILDVTHDAFIFFAEKNCTEILPFVAKEFWRRFYKYVRRAIKNNCFPQVKEQQIRVFCQDLLSAGYPPQNPFIYVMAKMFTSCPRSLYLFKKL